MQVTWWGSTHPVCHVTPSAGGALVLAGATADALMLLRCVEGSDEREVVYRPVNLLQALVCGVDTAEYVCVSVCEVVLVMVLQHVSSRALLHCCMEGNGVWIVACHWAPSRFAASVCVCCQILSLC
eukprot:439433-Pelagomonas_calceolata.AAC.3